MGMPFYHFLKKLMNSKKILIYNSGGGLGDAIQLFSFNPVLKIISKKAKFYYLGAHTNHFNGKLKEYKINLDTVDPGLKYFGLGGGIYFILKECQKWLLENLTLLLIYKRNFFIIHLF